MKHLKIEIEHFLFFVGLVVLLLSKILAKWIYKAVFNQDGTYVILDPFKEPISRLTETFVLTGFALMLLAFSIRIMKNIKNRKTFYFTLGISTFISLLAAVYLYVNHDKITVIQQYIKITRPYTDQQISEYSIKTYTWPSQDKHNTDIGFAQFDFVWNDADSRKIRHEERHIAVENTHTRVSFHYDPLYNNI